VSDEIVLRSPIDAHTHFRQGDMLRRVVPHTAATFAAAVAMPNTDPPIRTAEDVSRYLRDISEATIRTREYVLPLMTAYFGEHLTREILEDLKPQVAAVKFYGRGLTTNAHHGCDPSEPWVDRVLADMEELGMTLCVHPEAPAYFADRESAFFRVADRWARSFPRLKIVLEHLSDSRSLRLVVVHPNVFATITPHHLLLTGDDWVGPPLRPHNYCMPTAKRPHDRDALVRAATGGGPPELAAKVMLGTDSAPHPRSAKESAACCAGIFSAPIALQLLADAFDRADALDRLQPFVSDNARRIHGIDPPGKVVRLVRRPFRVPEEYDGVVPLFAGQEIPWSIEAP
jgi:dihydroorotase